MSRYIGFRDKLRARERVNCTTITFFDEPLLLERMIRNNLDFLVFDTEHGRYNSESLRLQLYICRTLDIPSIVRVQDTAYHLISKAIDMGADGVMLPRAETVEQVKTAVESIFFHPIGKKGYGGYLQLRKDEGIDEYMGGRFFIPQIESPKGINNLPAILQEYGEYISAIIIGPYDMSIMVGTPREVFSDVMLASVGQVFDICKEYGKSVGIYCNNAEEASAYLKMGANIIWLASDIDFFLDGYNRAFDALGQCL